MQENITGLIEPITTIPNYFLARTDQGMDVTAKFLMMEKCLHEGFLFVIIMKGFMRHFWVTVNLKLALETRLK